MRLVLVVLVTAAPLLHSGVASACSPDFCSLGGHLVPDNGATVPANLPGIQWYPLRGAAAADPSKVTLATLANPDIALGLTQVQGQFVPVEPLREGTSYIVTDHNVCESVTGPRAVFTVGPAAPPPATLGTLRAVARGVGPLDVAEDASCSTRVEADQVAIELDVAPEAAPWFDVLFFYTKVDGQVWQAASSSLQNGTPGTGWRGRGMDLIYRVCHNSDAFVESGLGAGKHVVTFEAYVQGMFSATSSSVEIEVACPEDHGGCSATRSPGWLVVALFGLVARRRRPGHQTVRSVDCVALVAPETVLPPKI